MAPPRRLPEELNQWPHGATLARQAAPADFLKLAQEAEAKGAPIQRLKPGRRPRQKLINRIVPKAHYGPRAGSTGADRAPVISPLADCVPTPVIRAA